MKLNAKVLLAFMPLSAAAAASVLLLTQRSAHRILVDELAQRVVGRASETAASATPAVQSGREDVVLPRLQALVEQTRADYAMALDPEGRVIAHTNVVEKGKLYADPATIWALARVEPGSREVRDGRHAVLDVAIPLWERGDDFLLSSAGDRRRVGTLRIGLPLEEALKTENAILRRLAAVLLLAGGIALVMVALLLTRLLRPIRPLTEAAARIGQGRYGETVPILSRDELGDLAESFNRMSAALAATTVSKRFLDDILDGMIDSLIVLDPQRRVRLTNAAACRLLGLSEPELTGMDAARFLADDALSNLASGSPRGNAEVSVTAASGERLPVLLSSSPIADGDGRPAGLVLVARDIRERKALEARMAQSEKLSAIGQLAAGVAHEINNPLGVILGFAQSLCRQLEDGSETALPLRSIERESLRCKELVQNLLAFSRQDRKLLEPLDLPCAVTNALLLVQTQARLRGSKLLREGETQDLVIDANTNQIQQIVINLCTNALDAMPKGGTLTVACRRIEREGRAWARLEVADTGTGISPNIRKKIFDPFFTTKEPGKGTGLGLSLVYELVQHHHGNLDFTSEDGRGTTFLADFPLTAARVKPAAETGLRSA